MKKKHVNIIRLNLPSLPCILSYDRHNQKKKIRRQMIIIKTTV